MKNLSQNLDNIGMGRTFVNQSAELRDEFRPDPQGRGGKIFLQALTCLLMRPFTQKQYQEAFRLATDCGNGVTSHMDAAIRVIELHRDQDDVVASLAYEILSGAYDCLPFDDDPQSGWPRSQQEMLERISRVRQIDKSKELFRYLCNLHERDLPKFSHHAQFNHLANGRRTL